MARQFKVKDSPVGRYLRRGGAEASHTDPRAAKPVDTNRPEISARMALEVRTLREGRIRVKKQKRWGLIIYSLLGLVVAGVPLLAHHGTAASYDQKKLVTVKGTVVQFLWRNPHSSLYLETKDENGKEGTYALEMWSPGLMVKRGFTRDSFKAGDQVEADVHPSLAGAPVGECLGCKIMVNGKDPTKKQ